MLQVVDGREVYVVEFDEMPELPITGEGVERPYAVALTTAIEKGQITKPGKYGIELKIKDGNLGYNVYELLE